MAEVNEHGIVMDPEIIQFGKRRDYAIPTAEIRVAEHEGKWFMALSMMLPYEGSSSGCSVCESKYNPAYSTRDIAVEAGKREAIRWLTQRIFSVSTRESHKTQAQQCIDEIENSNQMELF
jgi:hypothetical protein